MSGQGYFSITTEAVKKNVWFSNVFKGYREGELVSNGSISQGTFTCPKSKTETLKHDVIMFTSKILQWSPSAHLIRVATRNLKWAGVIF